MRKGNSIKGLKVIGDEGEDLGIVTDLIFDHHNNKCIGLILSEKVDGSARYPQVLPWQEIAIIGRDVVMIRSATSVIRPEDDTKVHAVLQRKIYSTTTVIHSEDGSQLGTFGEIYLDVTGRVVGYEVQGGFVADTISNKYYLGAESSRESHHDN